MAAHTRAHTHTQSDWNMAKMSSCFNDTQEASKFNLLKTTKSVSRDSVQTLER